MDGAIKRTANLGFALLAAAFFILPGTWIFYLALVTGYAHGFQGMYTGYKKRRFKFWQVLLAGLAIYPLSLIPHLMLITLAAVLATLHFVTDEFHLFNERPTSLTKAILPGLLTLLVGTLLTFFQITDKATVLYSAAGLTVLGIGIFFRSIRRPVPAETGVLALFVASALTLLFLKADQTSALVHLLGLMHFWSWYEEYYRRSHQRGGATGYLKQSLLFFSFFSAIGFSGWYLGNIFALKLLNPHLYFAWIIVHCVLSFRRQDIALWRSRKYPASLIGSAVVDPPPDLKQSPAE